MRGLEIQDGAGAAQVEEVGSRAAGESGAAGAECSPAEARYCDDGDPCTVDTCDSVAGCARTSAPDGTSCDDGNACTLADRCQGGACVGEPFASDAEVLGELDTFGGYDELKVGFSDLDLALALSETLLVFAEPSGIGRSGLSIKLVQATPSGLALVDRSFSYAWLESIWGGLWVSTPGTHLVALSTV